MSEGAGAAGAAGASTSGGTPGGTGTSGVGQGGGGAPTPGSQGSPGVGGGTSWTEGFPEDLLGYVQNKHFGGPKDLAEGYRNFEKLMGVPQDQLLRLPQKAEDTEGWNKIYSKLGRPEKAGDYNIPMPKENGDEAFKNWAQELFFENNLTKAQAEKVAGKWNEYVAKVNETNQKAFADAVQKEEAALKSEWGKAFEQNDAIATLAMKKLGISEDQMARLGQALGYKAGMNLLYQMGLNLGEHSYVAPSGPSGRGFDGVLTPAQAKDRIQSLRSDPTFVKRYSEGGSMEKDEMARLHSMAYPD